MKYTAISIGPISKTILQAKSTKAFWAASYLFSYIMKNLIRELGHPVEKFVTPYFYELDLSNDHYPKTGLFHDQLILKGDHNVKAKFDEIIKALADDIARDIGEDKDELRAYCKAYFNINLIQGITIPDTVSDEGGFNSVIRTISPLIEAAELTNRVNPLDDKPFLEKFLELKPVKGQLGSKYNFLHQNAFPYERKFPSTAEIATDELRIKKEPFYAEAVLNYLRNDEDNGQVMFYEIIRRELEKTRLSKYRKYLKYYAIVEADGDGFGKFIEKLAELDRKQPLANGQSRMRRFSQKTLDFSSAATALINEGNKLPNRGSLKMRGHTVYAGGDDLLFFAPVAFSSFDDEGKLKEQETIFDLIQAIDDIFDIYFTRDDVFATIIEEYPVSMSYGVAVSYYKFPLSEAKGLSYTALREAAKKTPRKNPTKNRIAFEFRGHSGDEFSLNFLKDKSSGIYDAFKQLCHTVINESNYINSLIPTLEKNIGTFHGIACTKSNGVESDEELQNKKWDYFFKENFNESVHTEGKGENKRLIPFLRHLKFLFQTVYNEHQRSITDSDKSIEQNEKNWRMIYSMLKFVSFIHNKEN